MKKRVTLVFLMSLILMVLVACTAPSAGNPEEAYPSDATPEVEETAVPTDLPPTATTEPEASATAAPSDTPEPPTDIPATEPPATETAISPTVSPPAATEEPTAVSTTESGSPPPMSAQISIEDFQFSPGNVTVQTGSTVTWTHVGNINHTVTADDGSFDSGSMGGGDVFKFTFTETGTYTYFCEFHGGPGGSGMSGTITVVDY